MPETLQENRQRQIPRQTWWTQAHQHQNVQFTKA